MCVYQTTLKTVAEYTGLCRIKTPCQIRIFNPLKVYKCEYQMRIFNSLKVFKCGVLCVFGKC